MFADPDAQYSLHTSVVSVNPGGMFSPRAAISARLPPFPPRSHLKARAKFEIEIKRDTLISEQSLLKLCRNEFSVNVMRPSADQHQHNLLQGVPGGSNGALAVAEGVLNRNRYHQVLLLVTRVLQTKIPTAFFISSDTIGAFFVVHPEGF